MKTANKTLSALFGRPEVPTLNLSQREIAIKARQLAGKLSISGVQPKLSLALRKGELVPVQKNGRYILKPQSDAFEHLPENEHLCMAIAAQLGIETPPNMLIALTDGTQAYLVKRFDRLPRNRKLACEDMAQILGRDKYHASYEQIGKAVRQFSTFPLLELQYLFERVSLSFILGNGDAHLKNFSLLTKEGRTALAPCYDMVSSRLAIPEESEELALTLNGRKNRLHRSDFAAFAQTLGLTPEFAERWLTQLTESLPAIQKLIGESSLPEDNQVILNEIVRERLERIQH